MCVCGDSLCCEPVGVIALFGFLLLSPCTRMAPFETVHACYVLLFVRLFAPVRVCLCVYVCMYDDIKYNACVSLTKIHVTLTPDLI